MRRRAIIPAVAAVFVCLAAPAARGQADGPPPAPVRVVTDTFFDTTVTDPYRWLERLQDSAVVTWLHAQSDYTARRLEAIPGRAEIAARIHDLSNAGPVAGAVTFGGTRLFYVKRRPAEEVFKLYVRDAPAGPERLLIDPERLRQPGGPRWTLDYYAPSWDGRYVAFGASPGGSEHSVLRILDVTTGRLLPDSIDRTQLASPAWLPGAHAFLYNRLQRLAPGAPAADRYSRSRVYRHVLGTPDSSDVAVLGFGVTPRVPLREDDLPFVTTTSGSAWAVASVMHGVQNELDLYVAPLTGLNGAGAAWRPLASAADSVIAFAVHGEEVFLLSHDRAPRFKVLRTGLRAPDPAHAAIVVADSGPVVRNIGAARDALYVELLDGGLARLERFPYRYSGGESVALPFDGSIGGLVTVPWRDGVVFPLASWTHAPLWYALDPGSNTLTDTGLQPSSAADFSTVTVEELRVPGLDGTPVPLSIVHRRDLARDGTNPTILDGYGAYGISYDSDFDARRLAWLERGGIFAVCHVRGGGEFGDAWHQAGRGATKANTWRDFIACAQYLERERWTSPGRLAGIGRSAGGVEVGMAIDERPDLFGAAVMRVGAVNPLRMMLVGQGGPANRPEFGDPTTVAGFRTVLAMDPYQHVRPGVPYPAVLLTTGMNDPRVDTWAPAKMAARLQSATTSGRPVLLRVDFEAGHGTGSGTSQQDAELADVMAFLLWQFRVAGFQPGDR